MYQYPTPTLTYKLEDYWGSLRPSAGDACWFSAIIVLLYLLLRWLTYLESVSPRLLMWYPAGVAVPGKGGRRGFVSSVNLPFARCAIRACTTT